MGYGQDFLDCLIGKTGVQDVQDVMDAIEHACTLDEVDENKLVIGGGSHGGFITGNLIGMYPDKFKAGIMRNPVTNLASYVFYHHCKTIY